MDTQTYNKELTKAAMMKHQPLAQYAHDNHIIDSAVSTIRKNYKLAELQEVVFNHLHKQHDVKPINMTSGTATYINKYDSGVTAIGLNKWIEGESVAMARPKNADGNLINLFARIETNDKTGMEQLRFYLPRVDIDGYIYLKPYGFSGFFTREYAVETLTGKAYKLSKSAVNQFVDRYSEYLPTKETTAKSPAKKATHERF